MKNHPSIGVLEFSDVPTGMVATDAMLKKAPIAFVRCGTITEGRFLTVIGGSTASVGESMAEGVLLGGESVLDQVLLADVHPQLFDGIQGARNPAHGGALAIVETATATANVRAAEVALKGARVDLVEIRLADRGLAGKGLSLYCGELHDIEAAVHLAVGVLEKRGSDFVTRIISAPHDGVVAQADAGTLFGSAKLLDLDGEGG
jgi:bacterial microcompartment shell protein